MGTHLSLDGQVTHHHLNGHPKILSPIIQNMATHFSSKSGHPQSQAWPPTYKTLRNSNQTWSLTLAQPSLFLLVFISGIGIGIGIWYYWNDNLKQYQLNLLFFGWGGDEMGTWDLVVIIPKPTSQPSDYFIHNCVFLCRLMCYPK